MLMLSTITGWVLFEYIGCDLNTLTENGRVTEISIGDMNTNFDTIFS